MLLYCVCYDCARYNTCAGIVRCVMDDQCEAKVLCCLLICGTIIVVTAMLVFGL